MAEARRHAQDEPAVAEAVARSCASGVGATGSTTSLSAATAIFSVATPSRAINSGAGVLADGDHPLRGASVRRREYRHAVASRP